jgi:hypothetical protein
MRADLFNKEADLRARSPLGQKFLKWRVHMFEGQYIAFYGVELFCDALNYIRIYFDSVYLYSLALKRYPSKVKL